MYKQVNTSMDSIFIFKCTCIGQEKKFPLIKQRYNSDKLCQHFCELEKLSPLLGPPPLQSSIARQKYHKAKEILGRTLCAPKGQRDANSSTSKNEATMDYSFLTLRFLLLQCIQEAQYIGIQSRVIFRDEISPIGYFWGFFKK